MLKAYEGGKIFGRVIKVLGAWVAAPTVFFIGVLQGLRALNWWPFGGGG
jgi:hypothetical protein